jgi:hypothetical protein
MVFSQSNKAPKDRFVGKKEKKRVQSNGFEKNKRSMISSLEIL